MFTTNNNTNFVVTKLLSKHVCYLFKNLLIARQGGFVFLYHFD